MHRHQWEDLQVPPATLRPQHCLTTGPTHLLLYIGGAATAFGQTFSWKLCGVSEWVGVLQRRVYHIKQTETTTLYRCLVDTNPPQSVEEAQNAQRLALWEFFNLDKSLDQMYKRWHLIDPKMQNITDYLQGMRALRQDPVECLFSFVCSSNNNITRITLMIDRLRQTFGDYLVTTHIIPFHESLDPSFIRSQTSQEPSSTQQKTFPSTHAETTTSTTTYRKRRIHPSASDLTTKKKGRYQHREARLYVHYPQDQPLPLPSKFTWFTFPSIAQLAASNETVLRKLGLGYRATSILVTAQQLLSFGGTKWLNNLMSLSREACQSELLRLRGVGRKVADCVALYSMNQAEAIPVDTHIWRVASRDMDPSLLKVKSLTASVYERVGDLFRNQYSPFAGWAQCYLFSAELPQYAKAKKSKKADKSRGKQTKEKLELQTKSNIKIAN